jgi:predicted ATPase/class 3 adenylate cyclase
MIGDRQHLALEALIGNAAARPLLDRYELMQSCWETREAVFFGGCVRGQAQRVLAKVPKIDIGESNDIPTLRDYRIAQRLRSTFAARIFALEASVPGPVIVYIDEGARPLALLARASLELQKLLALGANVVKGLCDLHQEGLVHCNLNLDNVWFCPETDAIRISDFTLAQYPAIDAPTPVLGFARDPRFTAPEQTGRLHQSVDQRTDVYAFGIILFFLLSGQVPFEGNDAMSIFDRHLTAPARFPNEVQDRIPLPLAQLVLKCLEKSSEDRYATASGLRADLIECASQLEATGTISDFALGGRDPKATFRIPGALYGREAETGALRRFAQSRKSRPAVMLVTGSPGVGKTAFLNQLSDIVCRQNGRFITGKFDQYRRNVPYFSLSQAFQDLVHQLLAEPQAQLAACRARLLAACEGAARLIIDVIPDIELIIGPQPPVAGLPPLEARNRFNRIFKNLVNALASGDEPLCLFMDDLQWADSASLELLTTLLTELETRCLIFVAAYRESEASPQLKLAIDGLQKSGINFQRMILSELKLADTLQLICDTVGRSAVEVSPLVEVLHSRTQGNPLYLLQLLHFLYESELISFDYFAGRWRWDLDRIRTEAVTDDVLDLLRMRIAGLPAQTRHILSVAACLGSTFDVERLGRASAQADVISALAACTQSDLIISVDQGLAVGFTAQGSPKAHLEEVESERAPEIRAKRQFRFLHDRIQQAAFDLVPDESKKAFRLDIGRRLLSRLTSEEKAVPQIDVLNNFDYAWELITNRAEKEEVARLNLVAGSKARETLAYKDALGYLSTGIRLLDADAWKETHELAFELHANALECEYLSGDFARAEQLFALLLDRAETKLAQAKVYLTKILLDTNEERYEDAIQIGLRALRLFGISYRRKPSALHLASELLIAHVRMRGRSASDLLQAPTLTDAEKITVLKILVALFPTAYFLSPNLLMFTGLKVVNYALRHGISHLAASGFVLYGLVMGAVLRRFRSGYDFGRLAVELAERGNDPAVMCKVLVIFALFIKYWRDPLDESFPLIERARTLALQAGDHQYANYAIIGRLSLNFSRGVDMATLRSYCDLYERFVRQSKDAFPIETMLMWKSSIFALTGQTNAGHSLSSAAYDEKDAEDRYLRTHNLTLLSYQYTLRSQLCYLAGRYEEAQKISEQGAAVITSALGQITVADHYLYRGLAATAQLISGGSNPRRLWGIARKCLRRLKLFAMNSPQNFLPYAKLLEADLAFAARDLSAALRLFNEAIDLAEEQKVQHLIGIANERAALCSLANGQRRAGAAYIGWARTAYAHWGASVKVEMMDREFTAPLKLVAAPDEQRWPAARPSTELGHEDSFDLAAASAALQAAASEKGRDRVLLHMMQRIRAQTGAEIAYLIVPVAGSYRIEASATAPGLGSPAEPAAEPASGFSASIVNYVVHAGSDLVVNNPHSDARFARCDYLARRQPKSVMCAAVVKQRELLGLIYLEHGRLVSAFDRSKLQWVRILASEVGLAIWAHRLSRYREYIHRFTPTLAAQEIDADPDSPDLAVREKDVSILFVDVAGYTRLYELMGRHETDHFVNRAFSEFIEEIHRCRGVVLDIRGDELLVLFQGIEDGGHACKAANAALSITRAAEQLNEERLAGEPPITVNMGINSGRAAIGLQPIEICTGARWRYDATGMTVNIAARIRELARDGHILISEATAIQLDGKFDYQDMGAHSLKNVSASVRIFRLLRESSQTRD